VLTEFFGSGLHVTPSIYAMWVLMPKSSQPLWWESQVAPWFSQFQNDSELEKDFGDRVP